MRVKAIFYLILIFVLFFAIQGRAASENITGKECFELGINYYDEGNFLKAVYFFEKAIEAEPDLIEAYYNLALISESLGDYKKAIDAYERIIKLWPQEREVYSRLAQIYSKVDNQSMADKYKLKTEDIGTHLRTDFYEGESDPAIVLIKRKLEEEADELEKKLAENPSEIDTAVRLGVLYRKLGQIDKSIDTLKKSLDHNPGKGIIYMELGIASYFKGDYDGFIQNTKRAGELGYTASHSLDDLSKIMEIKTKEGGTL